MRGGAFLNKTRINYLLNPRHHHHPSTIQHIPKIIINNPTPFQSKFSRFFSAENNDSKTPPKDLDIKDVGKKVLNGVETRFHSWWRNVKNRENEQTKISTNKLSLGVLSSQLHEFHSTATELQPRLFEDVEGKHIYFNVAGFSVKEINVEIVKRSIIVYGECVALGFPLKVKETYNLPYTFYFDPKGVRAFISKGQLEVVVPLLKKEINVQGERHVVKVTNVSHTPTPQEPEAVRKKEDVENSLFM